MKLTFEELLKRYRSLYAKYSSERKEKERLKQEVEKLEREIEFLNFELDQALDLSIDDINLSQFKRKYLTTRYDVKTMPARGGIYAYFNPQTEQLYIGQSVNMKNRLKQHFRRGSLKVQGHDSQFADDGEWDIYVLEYINRNDKERLDDREAYWIALGKLALSDKHIPDKEGTVKLQEALASNKFVDTRQYDTHKTIHQSGQLTNRTRGNNIKM